MSLDLVSPKEVLEYIRQGKTLIVDLREREEYEKRRIPGAVSVPYDSFDEHARVFGHYEIIILCCERGAASLLAGRRLSEKGYRVLSLGGGMEAWRGPTISG